MHGRKEGRCEGQFKVRDSEFGVDDTEVLAGLPATTQMLDTKLAGVCSQSCGSERELDVGSGQTAEGCWGGCDRHSVCTDGRPVPWLPLLSTEDALMSRTDRHPCPSGLPFHPLQ